MGRVNFREMPWNEEINQHLEDFVVAAWWDLKDIPKRHNEMMQIHADGWAMVAGAIERGLGQIAQAIRDTSR